jgi:multidrug efflux pump subunit AcrA (membrane-fusion protein)
MELVPVTTVHDPGLASIVRGVLQQAGIESSLAGVADDVLPLGEVVPYQILVAEGDLVRAQDVLAQYENEPEEDEDE